MPNCVLDASAVLAFLFREPGAAVARDHFAGGCLTALCYSEILTHSVRRSGQVEAARHRVEQLRLPVIAFDAEQALIAATLWPVTRSHGLSLADRACLALGIVRKLPVVTADRAWADIELPVNVILIR